MFTFSAGFEAATLKIPNKEYTAYGGILGAGAPTGLRGAAGQGYQGYAGSNDPYNVVTVNQGGVVVDGGRDGTMASWPASVPGEDAGNAQYMGAGAAAGLNLPPRKQIIGFAKFRTREEALSARDTLQGRRVDIEKGAVLKAEMAKKNLHTKRGVGPVAGNATGVPGSQAIAGQAIGGLQQSIMNGAGLGSDPYSMGETMASRDREPGTLGVLGLGMGVGRWRDQMQQEPPNNLNGQMIPTNNNTVRDREEEERRREREAGMFNAMGLSGPSTSAGTRGPRERAEEDERERRRKENDMRLRAGNSTAFDAFHSVSFQPPPGISRQLSNANVNLMMAPTENSTGTSPMMGNGFMHHHHHHQQEDVAVGPWDRLRQGAPTTTPVRPPSSSQRSTSPFTNPPSGHSSSLPFSDGASDSAERHHAHSDSSSSSFSGSQTGIGGFTAGADGDLPSGISGLAVSTNNGSTSPQLPSPASGASSGSTRNAIDQNPPVCDLSVLYCWAVNLTLYGDDRSTPSM